MGLSFNWFVVSALKILILTTRHDVRKELGANFTKRYRLMKMCISVGWFLIARIILHNSRSSLAHTHSLIWKNDWNSNDDAMPTTNDGSAMNANQIVFNANEKSSNASRNEVPVWK